ncbi:MAG TPA: hypothetical protein VK671_14895 [Mucilaginibacter sp.]|nr:hypothetical protein [Mucilaginibacter sp.]
MKKLILIVALSVSAAYAFCQTKKPAPDSAKASAVSSSTAFKMRFDQVFKRNTDGSFSPIMPIQINGEAVGTGVQITSAVSYGGVDVPSFEGHYLLVDTIKRMYIIRKFLK